MRKIVAEDTVPWKEDEEFDSGVNDEIIEVIEELAEEEPESDEN